MIKVIVFDLGGVVLTNDWGEGLDVFSEEVMKSFGISKDDVERGWKAVHYPFFKGEINEDEFWQVFLKTSGAKKTDLMLAKEIWRKHQHPLNGMMAMVERLGKKYRLAALTNISREWLDYKRQKFGLDDVFEFILGSGEAGVEKPDPKMYRILIEHFCEAPEKYLYIDDRQVNLAPARDLGMKALLFHGRSDLESDLRKMGIIF